MLLTLAEIAYLGQSANILLSVEQLYILPGVQAHLPQVHVADALKSLLIRLKGKVPEQLAGMLAMTQMGIREGKSVNNSTDIEMLLGRKPMTLKEVLQQLLA